VGPGVVGASHQSCHDVYGNDGGPPAGTGHCLPSAYLAFLHLVVIPLCGHLIIAAAFSLRLLQVKCTTRTWRRIADVRGLAQIAPRRAAGNPSPPRAHAPHLLRVAPCGAWWPLAPPARPRTPRHSSAGAVARVHSAPHDSARVLRRARPADTLQTTQHGAHRPTNRPTIKQRTHSCDSEGSGTNPAGIPHA